MKFQILSLFLLSIIIIKCDYTYQRESKDISPVVYFSIGEATVNNQPVQLGQVLKNKDIVTTGAESYVEVKFGKQSGFRIREESKIQIGLQGLDVIKGKVLNILEKQSTYSVRTPAAVAAVRGTIFFAAAINPDSSYFCACNGTIAIEDKNSNILKQLSSAHHQANFCEIENNLPNLTTAGMFEHDDREIFDFMYRLDNATKGQ